MKTNREGGSWSEYRWPLVFVVGPLALIYGTILILWRMLLRKKFPSTAAVPSNAIIYLFHGDLFLEMMLMELFGRFSYRGGWVLGSHSFLSYLWSAESYLRGWKIYRYNRKQNQRPLDTIIEFLKRPDVHTFRLATDSAGPYGRVRKSLVEMSLRSGRPLIAIRAYGSRTLRIRSHALPLPFSTVMAQVSEPIWPAQLAPLSVEEATALLQKRIDELGRK